MATPTDDRCDAGRYAGFGGRWQTPCMRPGTETLVFSGEVGGPRLPGTAILRFCHEHAAELIAAGLIEEPNVPHDEAVRRMSEGTN